MKLWACALTLGASILGSPAAEDSLGRAWSSGEFHWEASQPLIDVGPGKELPDPLVSIKDPTLVFHQGRWHMFATIRAKSGKVDIEYLSFRDWPHAQTAPRHVLGMHDQYYCAPQVFYFRPHKKWYLVYQLADKSRTPAFGPCFSTNEDLGNPKSWSRPLPMVTNAPAEPKWLDFWVICDDQKAHLFYTSLDGRMWRRDTPIAEFPYGWSEQHLALQADIFEASHTYRLKGSGQFLTVVEAQGDSRRYYKAYSAKQLEGPWTPLADNLAKPFAGLANVAQDPKWTANFSHGEFLRDGVDERMEIDPRKLQFLFQGASDEEYRGRQYGTIPWRLGLLRLKD